MCQFISMISTYIIPFSCTRGAYYAPYSRLLISNKFCNVGERPEQGDQVSFCTCSSPPSVWALKPPLWALVHKTTYDLYSPLHNVLYVCISITWASGRGLGTGILEFFWPQMALAYWLYAISQGPKNSRIPESNPFPLALVMDMHASKTLCTGLFKS
jgi:hypothetical protein